MDYVLLTEFFEHFFPKAVELIHQVSQKSRQSRKSKCYFWNKESICCCLIFRFNSAFLETTIKVELQDKKNNVFLS